MIDDDVRQEMPPFSEVGASILSSSGLLLAKGGIIAGGKSLLLPVVVALGAVTLLCGLLLVIMAALGAVWQHTAVAWPAPLAMRDSDTYAATGWMVTSPFGWRRNPVTGAVEFHDGIDIASPDGRCPFGFRCPLASVLDGTVRYVGWDQSSASDPVAAGGGQIVIVSSGNDAIETLYAHLEPYRLHVQLQGRIVDSDGRYADHADYAEIGAGELLPGLDAAAIELWCRDDMPAFQATRSGATVTFLYDRPASCRASVIWPRRGDNWRGWIADDPPADAAGRATLEWSTPLSPPGHAPDAVRRAGDVALRFRAHLEPPPPTATPVMSPTAIVEGHHEPRYDAVTAMPDCAEYAGGRRCVWRVAAIPTGGAALTSAGRSYGQGAAPWRRDVAETTPMPVPRLFASIAATRAHAPIGGRFSVSLVAGWNIAVTQPIQITLDGGGLIQVLDWQSGSGACVTNGTGSTTYTCTPDNNGITSLYFVVEILPSATPNTILRIQAAVSAGDAAIARDSAIILIDSYAVTPGPWPPPTLPPTPTRTWPTPISYPPPVAPVASATPVPPPGSGPGGTPAICEPLALVPLSGVVNAAGSVANMRLAAPAAASFQAVRAEILARAGSDPLARLADGLRAPEFRSNKPGVALMSWHMTGRAIDLDIGAAWRVVPEGRMYRVWIDGVDVTAIFERHGWNRIAAQGGVTEWWHYEYHPDGVSWTGAMTQIWPRARLQAAFPQIAWSTAGCGGNIPLPIWPPMSDAAMCVPETPAFSGAIEELAGCGPPLRAGDRVYQLDSIIGFVGTTGQTTGAHLHLGLRQRGYDGAYQQTHVCDSRWLNGLIPPDTASCWTTMADPLAFLPLAPPSSGAVALVEGAPYQLPPPNYPGSLYREPPPEATPVGQYWSPYANGGRYGGGRHGGKAKAE